MTIKEAEKLQHELDEQLVEPCPKCGNERKWGEARDLGCAECYSKELEEREKLVGLMNPTIN